jgi:hypothetical protein
MQPQRPAQNQMPPKLTPLERLDVPETFVDSLGRLTFDGINVKLEFVVHRFDDVIPGQQPTGRAISACRTVMPIPGLLQTYGQLTALINTLQAQGVIKQLPQMPVTGTGTVN